MKSNQRGKFITLYGINNLGKSTQAKRLVEELKAKGIEAEYLKYAIYDLSPSGPMLNDYLRNGNPYGLTPREFQIMQVINRTQYQPTLEATLNQGVWVIAEDYAPTGVAWGCGAGVDKHFLLRINEHLLREDLALYFYGVRFSEGIEAVHKHEQNHELTQKVAEVHEELADNYGWKKIFANQAQDEVFENIMKELAPLFES